MHPLFKTLMTAVPLLVALMWYVARRQASRRTTRRSPLPNDTEALLFGTRLIADGIHFFPDWSTAMVREFDCIFPPARLEDWHRLAQDLSQLPHDQWRTAIQRLN